MALTEEQKERIRKNRERALEIQRKRKEERERQQQQQQEQEEKAAKKRKIDDETIGNKKQQDRENSAKKDNQNEEEEEVILEDFEVGASDYVSRAEAKKTYCLPDGTLNVCEYIEKPNPNNKLWKPMKLYSRSEIRKKARKRFGGLQGLIDERKRRAQKQFLNDMKATKDIFR